MALCPPPPKYSPVHVVLLLKTVPHWEISRKLIMTALRDIMSATQNCVCNVLNVCLLSNVYFTF